MSNLVIVESPTKAKTLAKFLGDKYHIEASMGHIRDLPKSELGVDVENNFEPQYIIPRDKRKRVNELKKLAEKSDTLFLATDPDREGEAIAWHIAALLGSPSKGKIKKEMKRVVFHEITEEAIKDAFNHPRELDLKLVDAQQARRVLDRLVGYKLSPLLWKKIKRGLSAGRVQSVALRLIVEREKEIGLFKAQEYWTIEALVSLKDKSSDKFTITLVEIDGKKAEINNEVEAKKHVEGLKSSDFKISEVNKKEVRRYPYAPFTTSTLQQTSSNKLGMSAKKTMMIAQSLYEQGFITYMRTDSVNLSASAITAVRDYISQDIGTKYLPSTQRVFKSKSKNAQEAHEAIRPTDPKVTSEYIKQVAGFTRDHIRLYELIWKRFVACQMSEAVIDQTTVTVKADIYTLRATGSVIKFEGWLKLYGKEVEEEKPVTEEVEADNKNQLLPEVKEGQDLNQEEVIPTQHFTQPPPRYNEASLIKKLEELGIGRPSTYAPILSTIQERFYVEKTERKFFPTSLGITVTDFLLEYFPDVFNYEFTAQMEDSLDQIASGERAWKPTIQQFYTPFEKKITDTFADAEKVQMEVEYVDKNCPKCGKRLMVRVGKFGKFLACSGFPDCKHTEALEEKIDAVCPDDGGQIVVRKTRHGKTFYGCKNWPTCKFASWTKPKGSEKLEVVETSATTS